MVRRASRPEKCLRWWGELRTEQNAPRIVAARETPSRFSEAPRANSTGLIALLRNELHRNEQDDEETAKLSEEEREIVLSL